MKIFSENENDGIININDMTTVKYMTNFSSQIWNLKKYLTDPVSIKTGLTFDSMNEFNE